MGECPETITILHIDCVAGMTTNEHYKWGEVRRWHKEQVRKYKEYLDEQKGPAAPINSKDKNENGQQKPSIPDGDVGCTGGVTDDKEKTATEKSEADSFMEDPGPVPENIYNRGFLENWKEVFFPVSLELKAKAAAAAEKPKAT
jgi:hypothetical protein